MQKNTTEICQKKKTKKERIYDRIQRKLFQQYIEQNKKHNNLKSVEVDVLTNFKKDEVERFFDAEVYNNHDDDSEEDQIEKMQVDSNIIFRSVKQSFLVH